jgi:endonuclease-3 related protein
MVYQELLSAYGPQGWWPGESRFEVMIGAVLTQNTAWSNVERAIGNLRRARCLSLRAILRLDTDALAELIRPSGYFNVKARRLHNLCEATYKSGGLAALSRRDTEVLRRWLLQINGIGPETADDILLYAFERPVFVIDVYTRRIFRRLGWIRGDEPYEALRAGVENALAPDTRVYNEYHALLVQHAKRYCNKRPTCQACVIRAPCPRRCDLP